MRPIGRKYLARVLALAIVLSLISAMALGCGSGGGEANGQDDQSAQSDGEEGAAKKVALVLNGPISDAGWNANAYKGLVNAEEKYGLEIAFSENVPQADYEETFHNYASQGFNLIIANGFEFTDAIMNVAKDFPDVGFAVINGTTTTDNVAALEFDNVECGYITGVLAGLMTKSGKVGFVGGTEIPSMTNAVAGYKAGLASVNEDAELIISYVGSWDDVAKAKELAKAMIGNGVDVIMPFASAASVGVLEAAKESGAYIVSSPGDQLDLAPDTVIGSIVQSTPDLIDLPIASVVEGEFKGEHILGSLGNGAQYMGRFGPIPDDVQDKMEELKQDLIEGKVELPKSTG
jgi:basic membrane protein A